jgi:hypothetical protein
VAAQDTRPRNWKSIDELGTYVRLVTVSGGHPRNWQFPVFSRRATEVQTRRGLAAFGAVQVWSSISNRIE